MNPHSPHNTDALDTVADEGTTPQRRSRVNPVWVLGGAAAAVVVAGGICVAVLNSTVFTPEQTVQQYLDAVQAGDVEKAFGMSHADFPEQTGTVSTALLTPEALQTGFAQLENVQVTEAEVDGDLAEVVVSYTVGEESSTSTFRMERAGRDWGFFSDWQLQPLALQTVEIVPEGLGEGAAADAPVADVNGVATPLTGEDAEIHATVAVLPPTVIQADFQGTYLAAESPVVLPVTDVVTLSSLQDSDEATETEPATDIEHLLTLQLDPTEELAAEVGRQVEAELKQCTDQQVLQPTGCSIGYWTNNRVLADTIEWTVAEDPRISYTLEDGELDIELIEAMAQLSVEEIDLVTGAQHTASYEEPIVLGADLQVTPETVRVRITR